MLDPMWIAFPLELGGAHGGKLIVLRIAHPRYGNIDCQLNPESAAELCHALHRAQHDVEGLPPPSVHVQ